MMHLIFLPLGLLSSWFLVEYFSFNPVLASGLSSLLFSLFFSILPIPRLSKEQRGRNDAAFYCGSFVGMGNIGANIGDTFHLTLLSVVGVLVYLSLSKSWPGLGGKLGTIAFITFSLVGIGLRLWS